MILVDLKDANKTQRSVLMHFLNDEINKNHIIIEALFRELAELKQERKAEQRFKKRKISSESEYDSDSSSM